MKSEVGSTGASRIASKPPSSRSATNRRLMARSAANSTVTRSTPAARLPSSDVRSSPKRKITNVVTAKSAIAGSDWSVRSSIRRSFMRMTRTALMRAALPSRSRGHRRPRGRRPAPRMRPSRRCAERARGPRRPARPRHRASPRLASRPRSGRSGARPSESRGVEVRAGLVEQEELRAREARNAQRPRAGPVPPKACARAGPLGAPGRPGRAARRSARPASGTR